MGIRPLKVHTKWATTPLLVIVVLLALCQNAAAQEESFKRNGMEIFTGATFNDSETNASFGLTYERRVTEKFGIGEVTLAPEINFDFVDGDTSFVAGVSLGWAF
jgi:hypothetical protein